MVAGSPGYDLQFVFFAPVARARGGPRSVVEVGVQPAVLVNVGHEPGGVALEALGTYVFVLDDLGRPNE
jgi:hypothetical protein